MGKPTGSEVKVGNSDIGVPNTGGSKGGQVSFLPSAESFKGGKGKGSGKGSSTNSGDGGQIPFLPKNMSNRMGKGKK